MKLTFPKTISLILLLGPLAVATCEPALAAGQDDGASVAIVDKLVDWIGYYDFTGEKRDLFTFGLCVYAIFFGVLTDMTIGDRAFGRMLNGVVGVIGVCLVLFLCGPRLHLLGDWPETARFNFTLIASGVGSAVFLVLCAIAKGISTRLLAQVLDGIGRPQRPKPIETAAALPPRVASALRKN